MDNLMGFHGIHPRLGIRTVDLQQGKVGAMLSHENGRLSSNSRNFNRGDAMGRRGMQWNIDTMEYQLSTANVVNRRGDHP